MRVGIISDTHGLLRREALDRLRGVEHIVHAGDIGKPGIVESLEALAPVTAIRGNADTADWASRLPDERCLEAAGHRIHILHDLKALSFAPADRGVSVVISGHSHKPVSEVRGEVLYLNPGSAGPRRFRLPVTLAFLDLGRPAPRARIAHLV